MAVLARDVPMTEKYGIVKLVGWDEDEDTGEKVFRAIIEYPNGPPAGTDSLTFNVVWDQLPVKLVLVTPCEGKT